MAKLPPPPAAPPARDLAALVAEGIGLFDDAPPYAELQLVTGITVRLRRPELYAMLATVGSTPSQIMIDVLNLLEQDGVILDLLPEAQKFLRIRNKFRGMYALAAALIESPRLVLAPETPDRAAGEIGEEDISLDEVEWIYYSYFRQRRFAPSLQASAPAEPAAAAQPAPPGGDVPPLAA